MGRPIQDKWFGQAAAPGGQIKVTGAKFADATTAVDAYILSQTGDTAYMVQDSAKTHAPEILFMVNANALTALLPGQCYINATPFGGTALPAKKIAQYRITLFTVPYAGTGRATGSPVADPVAEYTWSTQPATKRGQANLISESSTTGIVLAVTVTAPGAGYFVAPTVTFPSPGVNATARATVSATGTVTGVSVLTGGYGYVAGTATIAPPPPSVTATATATVSGGIITAITVVNGGGFYLSAPGVTITPVSGGTLGAATAVISAGKVTGFTITNGGSGYTVAPTITIGAPPAATAATGTFTVTTVAGPFLAALTALASGPPPVAATASATAEDGEITEITVDDGGTLYRSPPVVTIGGDGTGATATATISGGKVTGFTITSPGSGYTAPTVTVAAAPPLPPPPSPSPTPPPPSPSPPPPGGGEASPTAATAEAIATDGVITAINVTSGGSGYKSAPEVTVGGDGTGATATATIASERVDAINVTAGGTGYTAPTVTVADPPPPARSAPSRALAESQANTAQQAFRASELKEQGKPPIVRGR